jgi:hypothetical protein
VSATALGYFFNKQEDTNVPERFKQCLCPKTDQYNLPSKEQQWQTPDNLVVLLV